MRWFVALAIAVMCFMATTAWAASAYDDVPRDHWAYNALDYLTDRGVLEGYPDGFFKGDRTLTRYEFAQAVARLLDTIEGSNSDEQIRIMAETLRAEFSDQLAELTRKLNEVYGVVNDMDTRVDDLEGAVGDNATKIGLLETAIKGFKTGPNWKGVFRYRWEFIDQGDTNNFRQRIMFMLGYSKQLNDAVTFSFRFKTFTGSSAVSGNHSLGAKGNWATADIFLDRAYVKYSPSWFGFYTDKDCNPCAPKLDIYAGIFGIAPVMYDPHEMILDGDINMHGAGLVYHFNRDFQISTAASVVVEQSGTDYFDDDTYFFVTEARYDNLLIPCLDAWVGCYGWQNENYLPDVFAGNRLYGFNFNNDPSNMVNGDDRFATNFNTIKGGLQYTWQCLFPKPLALYGEYMFSDSDAEGRIAAVNQFIDPNIIYDESDDYGWMVGGQYGAKPQYCGDWYAFARYKEIGANVIVHGFGDADTGGANTNSLEFHWGYMWADNCLLGVTYYMTKMHNAYGFAIPSVLDDMNKVQMDWIFTF
jgi:hypothetical protein